jgi:hypothetical protein
MTTKTYKYAGVSTSNGKTKIRFANDIMRIKVLDKNGHEGVNIKELPTEMLKGDAVQHLSSIGFAGEDSNVKDALKKAAKKYGVSLTQPAVETTSTENVA